MEGFTCDKTLFAVDVVFVATDGQTQLALTAIPAVNMADVGNAAVPAYKLDFSDVSPAWWPAMPIGGIRLSLPCQDGYLSGDDEDPLIFSGATLFPKPFPVDVSLSFNATGLPVWAWTTADPLPPQLDPADRAAIHQKAVALHSALQNKNLTDMGTLYQLKTQQMALALGVGAQEITEQMNEFYNEFLFSLVNWQMMPLPDELACRFNVYAGKVVELANAANEPVLRSAPINNAGEPEDRFLAPLRFIKTDGQWVIIE